MQETNYSVSSAGYNQDVDFTKPSSGLHPVDARGQYVSPKPNSKRNVAARGYRV